MIGWGILFAEDNKRFKSSVTTEYCFKNQCIVKISISNKDVNLSQVSVSLVSPETTFLYRICDKNACLITVKTTKVKKIFKVELKARQSKWEIHLSFNPSLYAVLDMR